jgi:hypothetical protein
MLQSLAGMMRTRALPIWHEVFALHLAKDLASLSGIPSSEHPLPHRRSAGQRAYEDLRAVLLNGDLPAGRIDIQKIAERFSVSPTPVREALARLASERLIHFAPGQGYAVARVSAKALSDLYVWTDRVLRLTLELAREEESSGSRAPEEPGSRGAAPACAVQYAHRVSSLFEEIAQAPSNAEFIGGIVQSSARLFRARTVEWSVLDGVQEELSGLILLWRSRQLTCLGAKIGAYHLRRVDWCEEIVRGLSKIGIA